MVASVRYGLRNRKTGRFIGLEVSSNAGSDFCNSETCLFSERGDVRYATEDLTHVLAALREDTPWFNTDHDRPGWNRVDLAEYDIVAFTRSETFDILGGDPVEVVERMLPVRLPELFVGEAVWTAPHKGFSFAETFGMELPADDWPTIVLVRDPGGSLKCGMMLNNQSTGAIVVAAAVDVPERWPMNLSRPFDRGDRSWKLVLASSAPLRDPSLHIEGYLPEDAAPATDETDGGLRP